MATTDLGCEVYIDSNTVSGTFYVGCDKVQYIGDNLVNLSGNTIYLYRQKQVTNNGFNPYIRIDNGRYARYYSANTSSGVEIQNVNDINFNPVGMYYNSKPILDVGFMFILSALALVSIFRKG